MKKTRLQLTLKRLLVHVFFLLVSRKDLWVDDGMEWTLSFLFLFSQEITGGVKILLLGKQRILFKSPSDWITRITRAALMSPDMVNNRGNNLIDQQSHIPGQKSLRRLPLIVRRWKKMLIYGRNFLRPRPPAMPIDGALNCRHDCPSSLRQDLLGWQGKARRRRTTTEAPGVQHHLYWRQRKSRTSEVIENGAPSAERARMITRPW